MAHWANLKKLIALIPDDVPMPDIATDIDGYDPLIEWYRGKRKVFSISVSDEGKLSYAGLDGQEKVIGTAKLSDKLPQEIMDWIRRVNG